MRRIVEFFFGKVCHDPEGCECRVGALWARIFLRDKWALTAFQRVWMKNDATWKLYEADAWWRAHEHHHLVQEREHFKGRSIRYIMAITLQYIRHRSHDKAPMELEANRAADEYVLALMKPGSDIMTDPLSESETSI